MPTPDRLFRFALYGRSNSGKTCILAAMAMPHTSRPGVSCVWRGTSADAPRPTGPEADWLPDDPATIRYRSADWLRRAVDRMAAGDVPEATPPGRDPFRYRFDIAQDGFNYPVELIDYAGELTNPDISTDELAARLKRHFRELDGIMLLASLPLTGDGSHLPEELHKLQMAFAELRRGRDGSLPEGAVVGLVVNKWDRRAADANPEVLGEFLESDAGRSHRTIRDFLRPPDGRDFEAFAVSAFGRAERDEAKDLPPKESPLPSFGLEEPFLWAARRRLEKEADAELRRIEAEAARFTWWRILQPFSNRGGRLAERVGRLRADYPGDFPHAAKAERTWESTRGAYRGQFAALAAVLFLGWGVATAAVDGTRFAAHRLALTETSTEIAQLESAQEWLARYHDRNLFWSPFSRTVLSRERARQELERIRDEVPGIRVDLEKLAEFRDRISNTNTLTDLSSLRATFERGLSAHGEFGQVVRERSELSALLEGKIRSVQASDAERKYNGLIDEHKIAEAAEFLKKEPLPADLREVLVKAFRDNALENLLDYVQDCQRKSEWDRARERLKECRNCEAVKKLLANTDELVRLDSAIATNDGKQDEALYESVRRNRTEEACLYYLTKNPLAKPRMAAIVETYRKHLVKLRSEQQVDVYLCKIEWGAGGWDAVEDNSVEVWLNSEGDKKIDQRSIYSKKGDSTVDIGSFAMRAKLEDTITLKVKVTCNSGNFVASSRAHGEGEQSVRIADLIKSGCKVQLKRFENVAFFRASIEGFAEPNLTLFQK